MKETKYIIRKIIIGVCIALCLMFIKSCNVNAEVIIPFNEIEQIKYTNINEIRIFTSSQDLYPANNYAISTAGESLRLSSYIRLVPLNKESAQNLIGQSLLVTVNLCSMENFQGLTDSNNVTGDFEFIKSFPTENTGTCKIKGTNHTANGYKMRMVISPKSYQWDSSASVSIITGNISFWGGGYAQGGGYFSSNGFSVVPFTSELENQMSQITQNNTIINQNDNIINNQNQINQNLTDESSPNINGLQNSAGWLKPGPVDSILNLPLTLLNNLQTNLGNTCNPVSLTLPYVDKDISLPCVSAIYKQIDGLDVWFQSIGVIAAAVILYKYFMYLYNRVDDTLSFRENNMQGYFDDSLWGGM